MCGCYVGLIYFLYIGVAVGSCIVLEFYIGPIHIEYIGAIESGYNGAIKGYIWAIRTAGRLYGRAIIGVHCGAIGGVYGKDKESVYARDIGSVYGTAIKGVYDRAIGSCL